MPPTKVCCFCESWESGGIESFLCNVLCRMDAEKTKVDVVSACQKDSVFTQTLERHGVRFYELSGSQRKLCQNHRLFRRLLRERRYDVLHLNAFHGLSLYYIHLAKKEGVPVRIAHSHNTALRSSCTRPAKQLLHSLAGACFTRDATDLWACSSAAADFLFPGVDRKKFRWIPNGIDTERFRFRAAGREVVRRRLGITDGFVIGNIGRLCDQKNQMFLLEVFGEAAKRDPKACLLLAGGGGQEALLKQKAERLGILEKVIFHGVTQKPEELLWAMDVFAFPSKFEGLGIAAVEAQAAGLPVVCSEHIPEEALATPLIHRVGLAEGSARWAEALAEAGSPACRAGYADLVRRRGFELADTAAQIEAYYTGESKAWKNPRFR